MTRANVFHNLSHVDDDVVLTSGLMLWQFASLLRKSHIGPDCSIGGCAVVDGARIGARARIGHGAQIHPGVVAGDDLFVGPGAIICNDAWPWLDAKDFDLAALIEGRAITVLIEDKVTIGAGAIVLPGVRLGKGCVVAAGIIVRRDVPPGQITLGAEMREVFGQHRLASTRMRLVA